MLAALAHHQASYPAMPGLTPLTSTPVAVACHWASQSGWGPIPLTSGHVTLGLSASCAGALLANKLAPSSHMPLGLKTSCARGFPCPCSTPAARAQSQTLQSARPGASPAFQHADSSQDLHNRKVHAAHTERPLKHLPLVARRECASGPHRTHNATSPR